MSFLESVLDRIRTARGGVASIHSSFSDFPEGMAAHFDFYSALMLRDGLPLARAEREWLAVETSRANQCPYCIHHHEAAYENATLGSRVLEERRQLLSELALSLTNEPWRSSSLHARFLTASFSEAEWQHAVMVVAYFNFANRCAHAMGLEIEPDFKATCK